MLLVWLCGCSLGLLPQCRVQRSSTFAMDCSLDEMGDLGVPRGNGLCSMIMKGVQESQLTVCDTSSKTAITPQKMEDMEVLFRNTGNFVINPPSFWKNITPITNGKEIILHSKFVIEAPIWSTNSGNHKIYVWNLNKELVLTMNRRIEYWGIGNGYNACVKRMVIKHEPSQTELGFILQSESRCFLFQMFDYNNTLLYNIERFIKADPEENFYTVMKPDGTKIGTITKTSWEKRDLKIPADLSVTQKAMMLCLACYLQRLFEADEEYFN